MFAHFFCHFKNNKNNNNDNNNDNNYNNKNNDNNNDTITIKITITITMGFESKKTAIDLLPGCLSPLLFSSGVISVVKTWLPGLWSPCFSPCHWPWLAACHPASAFLQCAQLAKSWKLPLTLFNFCHRATWFLAVQNSTGSFGLGWKCDVFKGSLNNINLSCMMFTLKAISVIFSWN